MSKTAHIFPGQGSQYVGMAKGLYERFEEVKEIYHTANELLEFDLTKICFQGPKEELRQTRVTQPAIFVHSAVLTKLLRKKGVEPSMTAGHSLGEYSALFAAGALTFEDALSLVKIRAELMQKAGDIKPGTMAAIIGLDVQAVQNVCDEASSAGVVQVANFNSPIQVVISGSVGGVNKAIEMAKNHGAKKAIPLVVSGAFHSPLMEYALEGLGKALSEIKINAASIPVYANLDAQPTSTPDEIKQKLRAQLTSPVQWTEIIENMIEDGATQFHEIGPGSVLTGLLKRINKRVAGKTIDNLESLENINRG
ncbi:ACP S-malonyltransferase [candidate division KSB1 bacterium]|nr:ACP S-malonyltransferase [candidate division KSB1 bacterium]NIR71854.1 ACP S-malonyltransferase [candidate division KSB1 bacterium]NIS25370.1 ACP S-malonyltransferase [candidate division KSB1 bacterium]NIT71840.1 ACP S-malonyltransferase [candidate division KSB1 bacterium]NIU25578.1 ACP S-malonyltransferase [candidate division KSB1 bacterium]